MADDIGDLRRDIQRVLERLAALEALIQSEAQRCPWREMISRIGPDEARITKLEERLTNVQMELAKAGLISGGASGSVVAAVFALGKALGWW